MPSTKSNGQEATPSPCRIPASTPPPTSPSLVGRHPRRKTTERSLLRHCPPRRSRPSGIAKYGTVALGANGTPAPLQRALGDQTKAARPPYCPPHKGLLAAARDDPE